MAYRGKHHTGNTKAADDLSQKEMVNNQIYDYVQLSKLPNFTELRDKVQAVVRESSWWDLYGLDWMIYIFGIGGALASYWIISFDSTLSITAGGIVLGICHTVLSTKGGHSASHGAVCKSVPLAKFWSTFFTEICGSFSTDVGYEIHILSHHPDTNIIGLGDSSTWRVPALPAFLYLTVAPLLVPALTPVVAVSQLWGRWLRLVKCLCCITLGLAVNLYLLITVSGFTFLNAVFFTFAARAVLAIPYIHVNIFQHIGLPMYSQENRPKKLYQMSTGVLNLHRNPILDYTFGHSIINCHVEHHLFSRLSDHMCLKIKPLVRDFLIDSGLPYNEAEYAERFKFFFHHYKELMVLAPPITHFVGVQ